MVEEKPTGTDSKNVSLLYSLQQNTHREKENNIENLSQN